MCPSTKRCTARRSVAAVLATKPEPKPTERPRLAIARWRQLRPKHKHRRTTPMNDDLARARAESAMLLGLDPDRLMPGFA